MIAKLAYLTSPAPNRFMLHIQPEGAIDTIPFEITEAHLANIIIDGASFALRRNRVPETSTESANERAGRQSHKVDRI